MNNLKIYIEDLLNFMKYIEDLLNFMKYFSLYFFEKNMIDNLFINFFL